MAKHRVTQGDPPLEKQRKARISLVETVYYQQFERSPQAVEVRFSRWLPKDEQLYQRQWEVPIDWAAPELGWIVDCSLLYIENNEGTFEYVQPTPEERATALRRIIRVGVAAGAVVKPFARVRAGESMRIEPIDILELRLCCPNGPAQCTITACPG